MPKILPLDDKILVTIPEDLKKSQVIKVEDEEKKRPEKGKVLAVGKTYDGILKKGDIVYFDKFGVEKFEIDGKEYFAGLPEHFYVVIY